MIVDQLSGVTDYGSESHSEHFLLNYPKIATVAAPLNARYVCSFGVFVLTESERLISIIIIKGSISICKQWPRRMRSNHIIEKLLRILIS